MSENYVTEQIDGELSVATVAQTGEIIPEASRPGNVYTTALVQTDNGPQLCVKTISQTGTLIEKEDMPGDKYTTALVDTANGPQLCVKTYEQGGGGGGGGGSTTKYGATVDTFLGDTDENGILYEPDVDTDLVFTGVKGMKDYALYYKFYHDPDIESVSFPDLENLTNTGQLGNRSLEYAFSNCANLKSASFPKLTTANALSCLKGAFSSCNNLTSVDFPVLQHANQDAALESIFINDKALTSVSFPELIDVLGKSMCANCTNLTTVSMPKLETVWYQGLYQAFNQCTNLANISFPELTTVSTSGLNFAFLSCTSLTSLSFPKLSSISAQSALSRAFQSCTNLTSVSFPALKSDSFGNFTNQFNYMLQSVTGCTVHFPSNLQSVIGSWADVTAGFGGTNTTVLFDLPATE